MLRVWVEILGLAESVKAFPLSNLAWGLRFRVLLGVSAEGLGSKGACTL